MKLICYMMYKVFMFGVDFFFKNVFIKLSVMYYGKDVLLQGELMFNIFV